MAVSLRLGLQICAPHDCKCGAAVDVWGSHAFICKSAPGRTLRHHAINELIARAVSSARIPVTKEPSGLVAGSNIRPDGISLIYWQGGKYLAWDATISTTLATSYLEASSTLAGSASEVAASKKLVKYQGLPGHYRFQPISFENLSGLSVSTAAFLSTLGSKISQGSGDPKETTFLRQRLSICLQRFNAVILSHSFVVDPKITDE